MSETEYTDEYIMQAIKHFRSSQHPHEQRSKSSLKIVKGATSSHPIIQRHQRQLKAAKSHRSA